MAKVESPAADRGPEGRAARAVGQLSPKQRRDVLLAALHVLREEAPPEARSAILDLYAWFAEKGAKRDPGAFVRRAILDSLRPVALPADVQLALQAANTYEFLPPGFKEDAVLLRVAALLLLSDLDDVLAGYEAARILVDGHWDPMSGEPALTAARVLAAHEHALPLVLYAMQAGDSGIPEVVSECLRSLTSVPLPLIERIVARHGQSPHGVVRIGLYDLLIRHDAGPQALDYLAQEVATQEDLDAYHYLLIALLSARRPETVRIVREAAAVDTHRGRNRVLADTLDLFASDPELAPLTARRKGSGSTGAR